MPVFYQLIGETTMTKSFDEELQELREKEAIFILRSLVLTGKVSIDQMRKAISYAQSVITND